MFLGETIVQHDLNKFVIGLFLPKDEDKRQKINVLIYFAVCQCYIPRAGTSILIPTLLIKVYNV